MGSEPDSEPDAGVRVELGKPIAFEGAPKKGEPGPLLTRIVDTIQAYRKSVDSLVAGKYADVGHQLPPHLRQPVNVFVMQCLDGVLVRYEHCPEEKPRIRFAKVNGALEDLAPKFSDGLVHLPSDRATYQAPDFGPLVSFVRRNSVTGATQEVLRFRPVVFGSTVLLYEHPPPPARPHCLASITNQLDLSIEGVIERSDVGMREIGAPIEQFLATGRNTLAVGWLAIEVYPLLPSAHWEPAAAPLWAECDLLSLIAQENAREASLRALDGRGEARRRYSDLFGEFERLLAGPEEPVHQFLKQHPELISPTHDKAWSKVPFGDRKSDFVFREPHLDYQLVEIEAAHRELFRQDGGPRQELTHAVNQIADWIGYIQDNKRDVEETLGLVGISANPRCLVVIGRSEALTGENRRKLETLMSMVPKLRILTYDDLLATARANIERLFGPLGIVSDMQLHFFRA